MNGKPGPFDAVVCERCRRIAPELPPEWETDLTGEHLYCKECLTSEEQMFLAFDVELLDVGTGIWRQEDDDWP
jgi:hypothetical protein